jgi:hypothetical protein
MTIQPQPATPAGWYPHPTAEPVTLRWFDGADWTDQVAPLPMRQQLAPAPVVVQPQPRKYVSRGVSGSEHALHAVLTVLTCGLWLVVWIPRSLAGRYRQVAKY